MAGGGGGWFTRSPNDFLHVTLIKSRPHAGPRPSGFSFRVADGDAASKRTEGERKLSE